MPDPLYVRVRGQVRGPFAEDELRDMVRRGQLGRMHHVSADGQVWTPAEEYPELFAVAVPEVKDRMGIQPQEATNAARVISPVPPESLEDVQPVAEEPAREGVAAKPAGGPIPRSPSQSSWYYTLEGLEHGPVDLDYLKALAARGVLHKEYVFKEDWTDWMAAADVSELHSGPPVVERSGSRSSLLYGKVTCGYAVASVILGALWLGGLGSLMAIMYGRSSLKRIQTAPDRFRGEGMATAGITLGMIGLIMSVVLCVIFAAMIARA